MINQLIITGRLAEDPKIITTETGNKIGEIKVAVIRSYKNADGEYETDVIPCKLWRDIAEKTAEYAKQGDLIGIRGRIEIRYDKEDNPKMEIIAEKVTFLSARKEEN